MAKGEQWQEKLGELMERCYKAKTREKKAKKEKEETRAEILQMMKEHVVSRIVLRGLEAVHTIKKKLPSDVTLLKPILKEYWTKVAKKVLRYEINRKKIEEDLIPRGKVDKKSYEALLIPEDQLSVKKVKVK